MAQYIETYDSFVEHPRYGKRPKLTGLNPRDDDEGVFLNPELSDDYLIEEAVFHRRQTEHVRMLLNRVPEDSRSERRCLDLTARLHAVEAKLKSEAGPVPRGGRSISVADSGNTEGPPSCGGPD